jgi:DNA-binding response OmpR family regulator
MNQLNEDIKRKIIDFLKDKNIGASSSEIAKGVNHNRITISKYLEIMNALNILTCKDLAQAKIWSIAEKHLKKKILIVDDEPHIVNLIKLSIRPNKYLILEANNGKTAISIAESEMPDLILLDLMMPEMDGFEVCKILKSNPRTKNCSIIMISAKSDRDNKFKGIDLGANDYLTKPFDPAELEDMVDTILSDSQDINFNRITGLSNKKSFNDYLDSHKDVKKIIEIKIKEFDTYKASFGTANSEKILKIISRFLKDKIKDDLGSSIFHTEDNKFTIITRLSNVCPEIIQSFEYMMPFIYHNKPTEKKISLDAREISIKG